MEAGQSALRRIYQLAHLMTVDREACDALVKTCMGGSLADLDIHAQSIRRLASELQQLHQPAMTFAELDQFFMASPAEELLEKPPANMVRLVPALRQYCLRSVLQCLPAGERIAFALIDVLQDPPRQVAEWLEIGESALRVRTSRARKKVVGYLTPRCARVNPRNTCRCIEHVQTAIQRGLIRVEDMTPDPPATPTLHEPLAAYLELELPEPPDTLRRWLANTDRH